MGGAPLPGATENTENRVDTRMALASFSRTSRAALLAVSAVAALAAVPAARADAVAEFYKGRNLTVIISFAPGGGYDLYARTITQHMQQYIPGQPTIVLQHMPGGGGVKAANYFDNIAPQDGSVIGMISDSVGVSLKLRPKGAKFDPAKWEYIGRAVTSATVLLVHRNAPATTLEALRETEITAGATGTGSMSFMGPKIYREVLGLKTKVVSGYPGTNPIVLAIEKGEVHAVNWGWASAKSVRSQWIADKTLIPVVQFALERAPDLPDVPLALELAKDPGDKEAIRFMSHYAAVGRAFVAPPGIPRDRLAALRTAFGDTMKDAKFLADAKKRRMDVEPASGEALNRVMRQAMATPGSVIAKAQEALSRK